MAFCRQSSLLFKHIELMVCFKVSCLLQYVFLNVTQETLYVVHDTVNLLLPKIKSYLRSLTVERSVTPHQCSIDAVNLFNDLLHEKVLETNYE